jgi:hypothetical protein
MKAFFAAFEQADVPGIAPVLRALSKRHGWEPRFIPGIDFKEHRGCLARASAPDGISQLELGDEPGDALALARGRAMLVEALRSSDALAGTAQLDARVLGASMRRQLFERPYAELLFRAYAQYEVAFDAVVRAERPDVIVLGEDTDYLRGRLAARLAAGQGIPVVCLTAFYYNVFVSYPLLGERRAMLYLVANRSYADRLCRSGVSTERIAVVGNPAFDGLAGETAPPDEPPMFLYALQGLPWEREIVTDLAAIFRDLSGAILAVKPHPALAAPAWLDTLATAPNLCRVEEEIEAIAILRRATCVIAQSSSLLYQATVLGRPVIVPHYEATPLEIYLPEADRSRVVARSRGELRRAIESVLDGRGRALGREEIAPYHPRATERVVECLENFRRGLRGGGP